MEDSKLNFYNRLAELSKIEDKNIFREGLFGLELENQRITLTGDLALTPHPAVFGDKGSNPRITTDFSESQIEMITPPCESPEEVYYALMNIAQEVRKGIGEERLWPLSMPPRLPEEELIPIARYQDQEKAREKYRQELALRYGKKMQMISGLHYNFSLGDKLIDILYKQQSIKIDKKEFIDNLYFDMIRNFLRYRWLLIYLYGASPTYDPSYESVVERELETVRKCCPECCQNSINYLKNATSIRVSRFGYSGSRQRKHKVYFNCLCEYKSKMKNMMERKVIQKESEFYSPIRPKQVLQEGETQLEAIEKRGVKYIEVRILDINPYEPIGIGLGQLRFLHVFLMFCLLERSKSISSKELKKINANHHIVALNGRDPSIEVYDYKFGKSSLKNLGLNIFAKLEQIAREMDSGTEGAKYLESVLYEREKLIDNSKLISARIVREMQQNNESFLDFGLRLTEER